MQCRVGRTPTNAALREALRVHFSMRFGVGMALTRWPRYSIRTLLVVIAALSIWLGYQTHRAREQRAALERIHELGGTVQFDYQYDGSGTFQADAAAPGPVWLRKIIGGEYFDDVAYVYLSSSDVTNDDLRLFRSLPDVETLWLSNTGVSDQGMGHLSGLARLKLLFLQQTKVGDDGLTHLGGLTKLEGLSLDNTRVTDAGFIHLTGLKSLISLNLSDTRLSGDELRHVHSLPKLEYINLMRTAVTDASLRAFDTSTTLWWIDLRNTAVTDDGVRHLLTVPAIKKIEITAGQASPETVSAALTKCQVVVHAN
jgi:hypothetical protein